MELIISSKLKSAMLKVGVGTIELSRNAKVTPSTVSRFLRKDSPVRIPTLSRLAKALNTDADNLINIDEVTA